MFHADCHYAKRRNVEFHYVENCVISLAFVMQSRGARYLTGENLEVVWAEFSTLS